MSFPYPTCLLLWCCYMSRKRLNITTTNITSLTSTTATICSRAPVEQIARRHCQRFVRQERRTLQQRR